MKTKNITVVPYDYRWPYEFQKIKKELLLVISNDVLSIEHIGSTSVEGLAAKPIIDIDIVIDDNMFSTVKEKLHSIGYSHEGDLGIAGREAFTYKGKMNLMLHHLYVCHKDSAELKKHIIFRNWLQMHENDKIAYSKIKIEIAEKYPDNIDAYMVGKQQCILEIYKKCGL